MIRLTDVLGFVLAGYLSFLIVGDEFAVKQNYIFLSLFIALILGYVFSFLSVYQDRRDNRFNDQLVNLTFAWVLVLFLTGIALFVFKAGDQFSRLWLGLSFFLAYFVSVTSRIIFRKLSQFQYEKGINQKHVIIVGAGEVGHMLGQRMLNQPWFGLVPVAFFDPDLSQENHSETIIPFEGDLGEISKFIESHRKGDLGQGNQVIEEVWVTLPMSMQSEILSLREMLKDTATKLHLVPNIYNLGLQSYDVSIKLDMPVMDLSGIRLTGADYFIKRSMDIAISCMILCALAPFMFILGLLVKLDSSGPILFKQKRYGLDGREFELWKFRSMSWQTFGDQGEVLAQAISGDQRITRLGRFIRKYSIDELPQLINVLKGDMSLVGPRPHANEHNEFYRTKIEGYMSRHTMRPGMTGWAQVNGYRGETPELEDMQKRIFYDLEYIRSWTTLFDLNILFKTFFVIIRAKNAY